MIIDKSGQRDYPREEYKAICDRLFEKLWAETKPTVLNMSADTITRQGKAIFKDLLKGCTPLFSLALDESTDASHLSQFSVIARYPAGDTLREESLAVLPIKGSTRGEDLFKSFMEFTQEKNLPMDKLLSVCTDGALCMVGKNKGFVALLREHENRPILSFHCILHQEALCAQMSLNDRQFRTLVDEVGNNYHGLLLHSNVRWLSRGKVLCRFAACLNEIRTFLAMKGIEHPELAETEWLLKFYYLVDMTEHLNQLNVKMQGTGNTVLSLQQAVFSFENKLELFIMDLETGRLLHFEKLRQFKDACTASEPTQNFDLHQLAGFTSSLLQSFKARFGEFHEHSHLFKFITHPNYHQQINAAPEVTLMVSNITLFKRINSEAYYSILTFS
uniref:DUF4371 domain-containing protein n=1 Tax=Xiphophorus maculatus TaxID=8083 RepID=A0A3B5RFG0_XIPMA